MEGFLHNISLKTTADGHLIYTRSYCWTWQDTDPEHDRSDSAKKKKSEKEIQDTLRKKTSTVKYSSKLLKNKTKQNQTESLSIPKASGL